MKLPGLDRKLRVATDWTLDLFLRQDIAQLKTDRTKAIASEHFDEGEQLVRQGDFGDKLFVIRSGRIERLHPLDECVQILEELIGDARGQLGAEPARQLVLVSPHHAAGPGGTPAAGGQPERSVTRRRWCRTPRCG